MRLLALALLLCFGGALAWGTAEAVDSMNDDMRLGALLGFLWVSLLGIAAAYVDRWKNGSARRQKPEHSRFPRRLDRGGE